ncbi:tyrosine-type recombinase/integrase [Clostridioides difficile]|nr:tyrosine-type recombinase/integrase [Clostridioides difficile]
MSNELQNNSLTFCKWLNVWLDKYGRENLKNGTINNYKIYIRKHIEPFFEDVLIKELTAGKLNEFCNHKLFDLNSKNTISEKTLRNLYSMIHKSLDKAVVEGILEYNPSDYVSLPKGINREKDIMSIEEQDRIRSVLKGETLDIGILLAMDLGIRLGEILALRWSDINFESRQIHIRNNLERKNILQDSGKNKVEYILSTPKTKKSKRKIPMNNSIFTYLKEEYEKQKSIYGNKIKNYFVVSNNEKNFTKPSVLTSYFKKVLKEAQVRNMTFHTTRHTFATNAISKGISPNVVRDILGHSSTSITLDIYSHSTHELRRQAIDKMM